MSKFAFDRDNILTQDERSAAARKCLTILNDSETSMLSQKDKDFLTSQRNFAESIYYHPSERVLAWLRDLVEKCL